MLQRHKNNADEERSCNDFFFRQHISRCQRTDRFSPFWIYSQWNKLNRHHRELTSFCFHATNAEQLRAGVSAQKHLHYLSVAVCQYPFSSFCLLHTNKDMPAIAVSLLPPTYCVLFVVYFASFHDLFTITGGCVGL